MNKKFTRTKENFTCQHCGFFVEGTGYTNHCPQCLWSKHVDINPGDRLNECGGMMEPIFIEGPAGNYVITHKCEVCRIKKHNKTSTNDDITALTALARKKDF